MALIVKIDNKLEVCGSEGRETMMCVKSKLGSRDIIKKGGLAYHNLFCFWKSHYNAFIQHNGYRFINVRPYVLSKMLLTH